MFVVDQKQAIDSVELLEHRLRSVMRPVTPDPAFISHLRNRLNAPEVVYDNRHRQAGFRFCRIGSLCRGSDGLAAAENLVIFIAVWEERLVALKKMVDASAATIFL
ncbi:MAG: hypothetical protein ABSA51_08425 [Anaerolineaceae bacterium]